MQIYCTIGSKFGANQQLYISILLDMPLKVNATAIMLLSEGAAMRNLILLALMLGLAGTAYADRCRIKDSWGSSVYVDCDSYGGGGLSSLNGIAGQSMRSLERSSNNIVQPLDARRQRQMQNEQHNMQMQILQMQAEQQRLELERQKLEQQNAQPRNTDSYRQPMINEKVEKLCTTFGNMVYRVTRIRDNNKSDGKYEGSWDAVEKEMIEDIERAEKSGDMVPDSKDFYLSVFKFAYESKDSPFIAQRDVKNVCMTELLAEIEKLH